MQRPRLETIVRLVTVLSILITTISPPIIYARPEPAARRQAEATPTAGPPVATEVATETPTLEPTMAITASETPALAPTTEPITVTETATIPIETATMAPTATTTPTATVPVTMTVGPPAPETATPSPSATLPVSPTATISPSPTLAPTLTATPTATPTPTATATATPVLTPTVIPTLTPTLSLSLTMTTEPAFVPAGQPVTVTLTLSNPNQAELNGLQLQIPLTADLSYLNTISPTNPINHNPLLNLLTWDIPASNDAAEIKLSYVLQTASNATPNALYLTAKVINKQDILGQANSSLIILPAVIPTVPPPIQTQTQTQTTTFIYLPLLVSSGQTSVPRADLHLSSDSPIELGQTTTLTATISGGSEPISYTFNFGDGSPEVVNGSVVTHTYQTVGEYTAVVTASNSVNVLTATTTVTVTGPPNLTLSKTGPTVVIVGEPITYTLTISNSGTAAATNLIITDTLPTGSSYLTGGIRINNVVSWTVASLASGETITRSFTVTASETITNSDYAVVADDGVSAVGPDVVKTEIINLLAPDLLWWNDHFFYRQAMALYPTPPLAYTPGVTTVLEVTVDTTDLIAEGKLQSDGQDLRVLYWDESGSAWQELPRAVVNLNSTNTLVRFPLQADIGAYTADYYLYFGNAVANLATWLNEPVNASLSAGYGREQTPVVMTALPANTTSQITSADGHLSAAFPAKVLTQTLEISLTPYQATVSSLEHGIARFDLSAQTTAGEAITQFAAPLTLVYGYDQADLGPVLEETLQIYYLDTVSQMWQPITTTVDTGANQVQATVDHLTPFAIAGSGRVVYVDADAVGNDGTTWATAFTELQRALAVALPGDEVWVATGSYYPDYDPSSGAYTNDRSASFTLKNEVALYGGFSGSEVTRDQRDWEANETILSGDLAEDDTGFTNNDENSYNVISSTNAISTTVLDGFTVSGGNANGDTYLDPDSNGGGMYNYNSNPTVANVTFSGNSAYYDGGGMSNFYNSQPTLTNVTFSGNSATNGDGGGMYNDNSNPTLTNVTFSGNSASYGGGGMYNFNNSNPTLTNVTFSGNSASWGGGMYNLSYSQPTLTNVTFSGNSATNGGGGMYNLNNSNPTLANVTFSGNSAYTGGGMYNLSYSKPTLTNVTFSGNSATYGGGMSNLQNSNPQIVNSIFWGNSDAGGIDETAQIYNSSSTAVISYSVVQGGWSGAGLGNISDDPRFV
ncbi:MAG: PKD domain-containing protein, partial [Aestuariibacter sp.]|nr:PKD domain-containing protein [Aestuariibacter sp.]